MFFLHLISVYICGGQTDPGPVVADVNPVDIYIHTHTSCLWPGGVKACR